MERLGDEKSVAPASRTSGKISRSEVATITGMTQVPSGVREFNRGERATPMGTSAPCTCRRPDEGIR